MKITTRSGRDKYEKFLKLNKVIIFNVRELKNFVTSDYLEIIKILGYNIKPMSYSKIMEKTGLANTSLSRALKWLQNIENEELRLKELKKAYFLKKGIYLEHIGINKSKNSSFKLTVKGLEVFNSEFLKQSETEYMEEIIKDFQINQIIWDFISRNKKIFLKNYLKASSNTLEPWTLQIFEFFDGLHESQLVQIQEFIPGPENMKLINLLEIIAEILKHHPVWKNDIGAKGFETSPYKAGIINTIKNNTYLREKLFIIKRRDELVYLLKSDKLIKAIYALIQRYLKIFYWQEQFLYLSKEELIQNMTNNVINELFQDYGEYSDFINDFKLEISYFIKKILFEDFISTRKPLKMPFNLMNKDLRELINFQLKRRLLSTDSEDIPPILLKQGASKDLIKEKIDLLVDQYFKDKNNMKNNLKLLEILVYNYSLELRADLWFYEKWKLSLEPFIQQLISDGIFLKSKYTEQFLILGFIFFNQKFPDSKKAIEINERLLQLYPTDEFLLENLIYLLFSIQQLNIDKIDLFIIEVLKIYPDNLLFAYSNIIIELLNNNFKENKDLVKILTNLFNSTEDLTKFIKIIRFFINKLDSHGFNEINLHILEILDLIISDVDFKYYYAKALERNGKIAKALKIYIKIMDFFPNMFLESYALRIFLNYHKRFSTEERKSKELIFLSKVQDFSKILMSNIEFDVNEGNVSEFEEKRNLFLKELRSRLKAINLFIKNSECQILPLKIKALMLKALNREKNLESTLLKILDITPKNIWAINELGFLYFQQDKFEKGFKLFELAELIKKEINYNIPYLHIISHSYLYEIHEFNFAELYKKTGKYNQAILIYIDYLTDLNKRLPFNSTAKILTDDLIFCYQKIGLNTDEIIKEILILLDKIEHTIFTKDQEDKGIFVDRSINIQHDPVSIKNSLIEYLYNEKKYKLCLEFILRFNEETPRVLENIHSSILSPFNINTIYVAECYLNLNDLAKANDFYEQAYQNFNEDIRYKSRITTILWLINPIPDYLRSTKKKDYELLIKRGFKKIEKLLRTKKILENLVYKTDIPKSIENLTLIFIKFPDEVEFFINQIESEIGVESKDKRSLYAIIVSSVYAIKGFIFHLRKLLIKFDLFNKFPTVSTLYEVLYAFYEDPNEKYLKLIDQLSELISDSLFPSLLKIHYLRYKCGIKEIENIVSLFKKILEKGKIALDLFGNEKIIFNVLKRNLKWYPFKWALSYETYIKTLNHEDIKLILTILNYIENKSYDKDTELIEFISQVLRTDRSIKEFLKILITSRTYRFPDTKYFIITILNPDIGEYGIITYGEVAYKANKLHEYIQFIDKYKSKEIKKFKDLTYIRGRRNWLEEQYLELLLKSFKNYEFKREIQEGLRFLKATKDYSQEKIKYFEILLSIRENRYEDARINSFQLLKFSKENLDSRFSMNIFKIWVLSKLLSSINKELKLMPSDFSNDIEEIIEFRNSTKKLLHYQLIIIDVLNHELLEKFKEDVLIFGKELFISIQNSIDWNNNKSLELLIEKIYFNKEIVIEIGLDTIGVLNRLLGNFNPSNFLFEFRRNYLYYIKAMIYIKNNENFKAKEILVNFFKNIDESKIYTTYDDINDIYLNLI